MTSLLIHVTVVLVVMVTRVVTEQDGCHVEENVKGVCNGTSVTAIPTNLDTAITSLHFTSTKVPELTAGAFSQYPQLTEISFTDNKITKISEDAFQGLQHLQKLSILRAQLNAVVFAEDKPYSGVSALKELYVDDDDDKGWSLSIWPVDLIQSAVNLQKLSLKGNRLWNSSLPHPLTTPLEHLIELDLSHNDFQTLEPQTFNNMPNLKTLNLNWNRRLRQIPAEVLKPLPKLEVLSLQRCGLFYLHEDSFSGNPELKVVDAQTNFFICNCSAAWMLSAVERGLPWAVDWAKVNSTTTPTCYVPSWYEHQKVTSLYIDDLTCDLPEIKPISPTITNHTIGTALTLEAMLTKGTPQVTWLLPNGNKKYSRPKRAIYDGIYADATVKMNNSDHSVLASLTMNSKYKRTGTHDFTLVARNHNGETSHVFTVNLHDKEVNSAAGKVCSYTLVASLVFVYWAK